MKKLIYSLLSSVVLLLVACGTDILPKPKGVLRLEYPQASYQKVTELPNCPFTFEVNTLSELKYKPHSCDVNIEYPAMKATVYNIASTVFMNDTTKVYGMFYQVYGNAASQAQFYATDSVRHFISGSVYFRVVPNYDSVQPASNYLEKDVRRIMESLRWK